MLKCDTCGGCHHRSSAREGDTCGMITRQEYKPFRGKTLLGALRHSERQMAVHHCMGTLRKVKANADT